MAFAYPIIETLLQRHIKEWSGKLSDIELTHEEQAKLKEIFLELPAGRYPYRRYVRAHNVWIYEDKEKYSLATIGEVDF